MRRAALAGVALTGFALASCSSATPKEQQIVIGACQVDGVAQPVLVNAAPVVTGAIGTAAAGAAPVVALVSTIDSALVHPLVEAACGQVAKAFGAPAAPAAAVTATVPTK